MAIIKVYEPINRIRFWQVVLGEFLGTMLLVAFGCGITYINFSHGMSQEIPHSFRVIFTGAGFGIVVGGVFWLIEFGFPEGTCHINPAVTLAKFVLAEITLIRAIIYFFAQVAGGIVGAAFLYAAVPSMREIFFPCTVLVGVDQVQALVMEVGETFFLVFGALTSMAITARFNYGPVVPVVALTSLVAILVIVGSPYTGASINPARSFGPAVLFGGNCWPDHWVYWAGPLTGGVLAGVCLRIMRYERKPASSPKDQEAADANIHG